MHNLDIRRHMELFDPYYFEHPVTIIGAGATGSWLALALAKLGIEDITVYDFDVVEEHNIPNQAYDLYGHSEDGCLTKDNGDVGGFKVNQLRILIEKATGTTIKVKNETFTDQRITGIVFLMVDSMAARKQIWEDAIKLKTQIALLVEPRMGLDMARIYNVEPTNLDHIKKYENTFYTDEEAEVSACGASMTVITTAMSVAAYCARQLINFQNKIDLDNEILIDFKYNNLITERWD
ncbi:hypothetical protein A7K50_03415 [Dehalobacter sp. MCB1]|uniref:ThiF family adenylyltransferase n=1 Tax=Dehalobacter sp. MCB1 TaxID=1844756 RepID=UPI000E6BB936|nr:ThiF family adenylyltransferase [Dehalobacter sp. MCB1]RJE47710.1 hypothetical protein A7K50_03415 [Dehalobacter sp. MCB1]